MGARVIKRPSLFDLELFVPWIKEFCNKLLVGSKPFGTFYWKDEPFPNLLYLNDIVWMKWLIGDLNPTERQRNEWIESINNFQFPEGGFYHNAPPLETHTWQHATWRAFISLNMLNGQTRYPTTFIQALRDKKTCRDWIVSHRSPFTGTAHHRYTLGTFVISSGVTPEWIDTYFSSIDELQDSDTGFWRNGTGKLGLSPTFMFSVIHISFDREIPLMSKIVDTILSLQRENGIFSDDDSLSAGDMDAVFLLRHICSRLNYRREEALDAMRKLCQTVNKYWLRQREQVFLRDPHKTLCICGLLSELKNALPGEIAGRQIGFPYAARELIHLPRGAAS